MLVTEFLITSLIVVLIPGTGVLFTVSTGLTKGWRASLYAAMGCTLGIVPHLLASVFGLAALLHASSVAFQVVKFLGVLYLAYLAWRMWRESGSIALGDSTDSDAGNTIALRAFLINILNPKLSVFFLAFLPQFIPADTASPVPSMLVLSGVFMLMTLVVFIGYGVLASHVRRSLTLSPSVVKTMQRIFAGVFAALAARLAVMER